MHKWISFAAASYLIFLPVSAEAAVDPACVYIEAIHNNSSIQMYYQNNCGECLTLIPYIRNNQGQMRVGTNLRALSQGRKAIKLQDGEGQNVFFDWVEGTWTGVSRSVRPC